MSDPLRIDDLIARARRRMRLQYVIDYGTLGVAAGLFLATVAVGVSKAGFLAQSSQPLLIALCVAAPLAGIVAAFLRRIDDVSVAARIDESNGFDDRLASALQFSRDDDVDATPFKKAQIEDTLSRLDGVDPRKAHAFQRPKDLNAVAIFAAALAIMALVQFPEEKEKGPRPLLERVVEDVIAEDEEIHTNLDAGLATFRKDQVEELIRKAEEAESDEAREAAEELRELLEEDQRGEVTPEEFAERLESVAKKLDESDCGSAEPSAVLAELTPLSATFAGDEFSSTFLDLLGEKDFGEAAELVDSTSEKIVKEGTFASGVDKKAFYAQVDSTVERHLLCTAKELDAVEEKLKEAAAAELGKNDLTKELAEAIKEGDMEKAAQEMEALAEKMANNELSEKQMEELAKLLEKFADSLDLNDPDLAKKFEKYKNLVDKLEKKFKQKGNLTPKEQRQLDDAKKNLERLQRQKDKNERGEAGRRLKRLKEQTKAAADELRREKQNQLDRKGEKGEKGEQGEDGEKRHSKDADKTEKGQQGEKGEAGEDGEKGEKPEMKAADEMRRLKKDQDGEQTKDDIKEATDRLKEDAKRSQGSKGKKKELGNDERANKIDEFLKQAKGGEKKDGKDGKGGKPGEGKGEKGEGKGQGGSDGGDGKEPGGDGVGEGHEDPDGPRTADLDSLREDTKVQGEKGQGPSTAETIKKASQSGFSSRKYKEVYEEYEKAVEDVLEAEKVPPGYRHYVRTYFDFIRPQDSAE